MTIFLALGLGVLLGLEEAGAFMLPGDVSLIAAGVRTRTDGSALGLLPLWVLATLGMVAGASSLYHTIRVTGRFDRVMPRRVRDLIQQHGVWGVGVARLLPGLRNATVFAAASSTLPYRVLLGGLVPAAAAWSGLLLLVGWFGGAAMLSSLSELHHSAALRDGSLLLLAVAGAFIAWRLLAHRRPCLVRAVDAAPSEP